jgi:enoyl-CoA hydratase/carnithine racemase
MNELVRDSDIAILTSIALVRTRSSPGVPENIAQGVEQLDEDHSIVAIVLVGDCTFMAGADIKAVSQITLGQPRGTTFQNLLPKIEDFSNPS